MISVGLQLLIVATMISTSLTSDEFVNESRWTVALGFVEPLIVAPNEDRIKRFASRQEKHPKEIYVSIANWTLKTVPNDRLVISPDLKIHWIESSVHEPKRNVSSLRHHSDCEVRQGYVLNNDESIVALTICADEFYVMLKVDGSVFYVRPTTNGRHVLEVLKMITDDERISKFLEETRDYVEELSNLGRKYSSDDSSDLKEYSDATSVHLKFTRGKRACFTDSFFNLTGDTLDLESGKIPVNVEDWEKPFVDENVNKDSEPVIEITDAEDSEHVGYFFDRTWEKTKLPKRKTIGNELPPRWLELGMAIDYSVIDFHGDRVQQYIYALLNIVSAIYKDPSLDSNLKIIVVRLVFYMEKIDGMVSQGNARKSLENVNKWNRKLLAAPDENHDVAVWLTRLDIGGPSGYAPVSGACDPARSCALNRDEGLTSAFIIAHEVAHILGLTHDGDEAAGNTCGEEASMGSVMAPMVAATFHRFHWSSCSRKEFHRRVKHFQCLDDKPGKPPTNVGATLKNTFTMDEQCRMEFGDGYALCRTFELPGPCSHLWCGHSNSSQICKTKKGPPLEGTTCGEDKWCINGYCEHVDRKRFGLDPVINNARDGGWSHWGPWGKCLRPCGIGVQFRYRFCTQPPPAFGGKSCVGSNEEFKTCEQPNCIVDLDLRQQQCQRLPSRAGFNETSEEFHMTWLPHENDEDRLKCRLSCRSAESGKIYLSEESVQDGTLCKYGSMDICVQGKCRRLGCDKILNSKKKYDTCGVCDGDDSTCSNVMNKFQRKIRRGMTRVSVIPRGSYNLSIEVTIDEQMLVNDNVTFTIRDARRHRNDLTGFDSTGRGSTVVVEGAAFRSRKIKNTYEIWSRGPILAEVIVSLAVSEKMVKSGVTIFGVSRYIINRNDTSNKGPYSWISGGWSSCSASCGGGTRHKTVACKEDETGRIVNRKKCSLLSKPVQHVEKCNIFSCEFKWVPGPWEGCTATCGNEGIQYRQIYCLHASFDDNEVTKQNEVSVYSIMVQPIRCKDDRPPENKQDCNRTPCPGNWIFTDWSKCTQSCGKGIQSRMARCVPSSGNDQNYECIGSSIPHELRACRGRGRRNTGCDYFCRKDKSKYCLLTTLKRYCRLPGFRRRCCRSCQKAT